jgi:predicted kinase
MTSDELPSCVIVSGMPGAGKSTVTRMAARLLPRAARVGGDDVSRMIGSGFVWFMGKPTNEALRQDELCNRNMCSLANNFIDFGFTVLMDSVLVDRPELDFFLALLSPRPVQLVILAPGIDECRRRNATRDPQDQFEFDGYERLEADMKREFSDCAWWFDTAALTQEETADQLVAGAAHPAPPRPCAPVGTPGCVNSTRCRAPAAARTAAPATSWGARMGPVHPDQPGTPNQHQDPGPVRDLRCHPQPHNRPGTVAHHWNRSAPRPTGIVGRWPRHPSHQHRHT